MKPLHDTDAGRSSPCKFAATSSSSSMQNIVHQTSQRRVRTPSCRRCSSSGGRGRVITSHNVALLLLGLLFVQIQTSSAQQQQQQQQQHNPRQQPRGLTSKTRAFRVLGDGLTECAGCNTPTLQCTGTTPQGGDCPACATGQTWWPCNVLDECYCKDLAAAAQEELEEEEEELAAECEMPLCGPNESGTVPIPFSDCEKYVVCSNGVPGNVQTCPAGQKFSERIKVCNIQSMVICPPDPSCPPTRGPTPSPTSSGRPTNEAPTGSPAPSFAPTKGSKGPEGGGGGAASGVQTGPITAGGGSPGAPLDPTVLEGMYVMDAHMAANKIVLTRELLTSPGTARGKGGLNDFSYMGLRSSLHSMITTGAANQTFYIGHPGVENGRAYGIVNIAAFLAMSAEDSIMHGSCDEVNTDLIGGVLPISNACGQNGMSYQDMTCPRGEEMYNCDVDLTMRGNANPVNAAKAREEGDGSPPLPFYCGPTSDYEGYTGHWDYASNKEHVDPPVANGMGRLDVEGCCWWGRGSIQIRGVCAYGKLNYFLGKRAHDEGRPAMFPDVDFCNNPQAVCSHEKYPDLKWIAGMFRWITEVQTYNQGDFNYMQRLINFVDGGLWDWSFVHGVSGIVTQGCHEPPCMQAAEFDGAGRKATFIKTLKLMGLSVSDETATSRRLGGSSG